MISILEQREGIKITNLKARVLQYFDDTSEKNNNVSDLSDQHHDNLLNKNIENFHKDKQIDETDRSDRSYSKEEYISDVKLVNISGTKKVSL